MTTSSGRSFHNATIRWAKLWWRSVLIGLGLSSFKLGPLVHIESVPADSLCRVKTSSTSLSYTPCSILTSASVYNIALLVKRYKIAVLYLWCWDKSRMTFLLLIWGDRPQGEIDLTLLRSDHESLWIIPREDGARGTSRLPVHRAKSWNNRVVVCPNNQSISLFGITWFYQELHYTYYT